MNPNYKQESKSKYYLVPKLTKYFAWLPTKMTSGSWIWLSMYWHAKYYNLLTFKCSSEEKLILHLQGRIHLEKLSTAYVYSLYRRNHPSRQNRSRK